MAHPRRPDPRPRSSPPSTTPSSTSPSPPVDDLGASAGTPVDRRRLHHRLRRSPAHRRQPRRPIRPPAALLAGLATFLAGSVARRLAPSTGELVASTGVMGLGGALHHAHHAVHHRQRVRRSRASAPRPSPCGPPRAAPASPSARSSAASLMRSFSWSAVFWINVPLLAVALIGALHVVPDSRDPHATSLDPIGALFSIGRHRHHRLRHHRRPRHGWLSSRRSPPSPSAPPQAAAFMNGSRDRD